MLRIYFLQHWFNLSDPAVEESLYDMISMRAFARVDLGESGVPDETTICKFRHLIEQHDLGKKLFAEVNRYLADCGITISGGTIIDATIIHAPSSTKNQDGERDPEMHQTRKGNQWYFGMKAHIGADSRTKLVHSIVATAANVHDSTVVADLLHGSETRVYGDSAYTGESQAIRGRSPRARAFINKRAYRNRPLTDQDRETNRRKSSVRSRAEHIFGTVKGYLGFKSALSRDREERELPHRALRALQLVHVKEEIVTAFDGIAVFRSPEKSGFRPEKPGRKPKSRGMILKNSRFTTENGANCQRYIHPYTAACPRLQTFAGFARCDIARSAIARSVTSLRRARARALKGRLRRSHRWIAIKAE